MVARTLKYEVNCSILFTELPLLARPAAAKQAGFDAVEFWWPFPVAVPSDTDPANGSPVQELRRWRDHLGIPITLQPKSFPSNEAPGATCVTSISVWSMAPRSFMFPLIIISLTFSSRTSATSR